MIIPDITEQQLLERVDEYSLFCFYLEFQPVLGSKYRSKLRPNDTDPSFGVFERKTHKTYGGKDFPNEFLWKDQGLPGKNFGDIFDLVQILFNLPTRLNALWKICADFGLGESYEVEKQLIKIDPIRVPPTKITIQSREFLDRDLKYWKKYNITPEILKEYNCTAVKLYKLNDEQTTASAPYQCYAYRISTRYQLYQPFLPKDRKFRNNWIESDVPGWNQLQRQPICFNTKSYKDVMCLRSFGYNAVSPRGENILLPEGHIKTLEKEFELVITLFDNDGKHSADKYPFPQAFVPLDSGTKDITDFCAKYGNSETSNLLKEMIHGAKRRKEDI